MTIPLDELMHAACRQYSHAWYAVTRPFVIDGWEYATDFSLCVRRRTAAANTKPAESDRYPNVASLRWNVEGSIASPIQFGPLPPQRVLDPHDELDDDEPCRCGHRVGALWFHADYLHALSLAGGVIHEPQIVTPRNRSWGLAVVGDNWQGLLMPVNMDHVSGRKPVAVIVPLRRLIRRHLEAQAGKGATQ